MKFVRGHLTHTAVLLLIGSALASALPSQASICNALIALERDLRLDSLIQTLRDHEPILRELSTTPTSSATLDRAWTYLRELQSRSRLQGLAGTGIADNALTVRDTLPVGEAASGNMNEGIHFIQEGGVPKVVKVLSMPPELSRVFEQLGNRETFPALAPRERDEASKLILTFMKEIENAFHGGLAGAPRLYGVGVLATGRGPRFVLELEDLTYRAESFTLKITSDEGAKLWARLNNVDQYYGPTLGKQGAFLLRKAFERRLVPSDPDFLFNELGEVRWIDTGEWERVHDLDEFLPKFGEEVFNSIHIFTEVGMNELPHQLKVRMSRDMLKGFLQELVTLRLSDDQRVLLFEGMAQSLRFEEIMKRAGSWQSREDPEDMIRLLYEEADRASRKKQSP